MIPKNELMKYVSITGFNLGYVERDYLQHLFLLFLSRESGGELAFKGGTALQKAYGLNRFSADLDFTQIKESDLTKLCERISKDITTFGYHTESEEIKTIGRTFIIKIRGPLYNGAAITIYNLKFEISLRENILDVPTIKEIIPVYADLQPYNLLVMTEREILAEKARAIITRNQPRDVFDLRFLLKKGAKMDINFISKKLNYYNEKFDMEKFISKVKEKKPLWKKDLANYIKNMPDFDLVLSDIESSLK